jgi:ATP-dependent helicase HrpB
MLIEARTRGIGRAAADVAVLLTERGLGGKDPDLELRRRRWITERGARADAARKMARRWSADVGQASEGDVGMAVALAFPDRVARRRDGTGEHWQSIGGRGFRLDPASPLASASWLAIAEVAGAAAGARILSAAAMDEQAVLGLFGDQVVTRHEGAFDPTTGAVLPMRTRRLGAIRLASGPDPDPDRETIAAALLEGVRAHGLALLPWSETAVQLRARTTFAAAQIAGMPALDDDFLLGALDDWLSSLLTGRRRLADIPAEALTSAIANLLDYDSRRRLDRIAPAAFVSPAGSHHEIDYLAPGGPSVEVRAQALFGLARHPTIADGRVPLTVAITSPAGRPIQTSRDLPGFWAGSWKDVAKEMRGRYPRHPWPDDPATAAPTLRTKRASAP